jgi:hypothetical protein
MAGTRCYIPKTNVGLNLDGELDTAALSYWRSQDTPARLFSTADPCFV